MREARGEWGVERREKREERAEWRRGAPVDDEMSLLRLAFSGSDLSFVRSVPSLAQPVMLASTRTRMIKKRSHANLKTLNRPKTDKVHVVRITLPCLVPCTLPSCLVRASCYLVVRELLLESTQRARVPLHLRGLAP